VGSRHQEAQCFIPITYARQGVYLGYSRVCVAVNNALCNASNRLTTEICALEADIENEVGNAYQQYTTAQALLPRIETDMLNQSRNVRPTIEYSYRRGQSRVVEFFDAQRAVNDTKQSYNNVRAAYARSLYVIQSVCRKAVPQ